MSAEELREELRARLEADAKLKALMDQSGSNNPPPSSATRIPDSKCAAGQGLKPDRSGFGRWTCQVLTPFKAPPKGEDYDPSAQEEAETRLREAKRFIDLARIANEGAQLLANLSAAEAAFRNAASKFQDAGDPENMTAAIQEASRIALIRFVERYEGKALPTQKECNEIRDKNFLAIDKNNDQSISLIARITHICAPVLGA